MGRLYLMRHGETLFNVEKRIQGWCDSPLTERGREQARAAGRYLRDRGVTFDHLYCSTSERASDTLELVMEGMGARCLTGTDAQGEKNPPSAGASIAAAPSAGALADGPGSVPMQPDLPYERMRDLKEMHYGSLEGMPEFLNCATPEECVTYYLQFGGESSDTVRDRMLALLTAIMRRPGHESVLAVSHSGATFNFLRALQDPTEELNRGWGNCTICVYRFLDGRFALEEVIRNPGM